MRLVSYVEVKRFKFDYTCGGEYQNRLKNNKLGYLTKINYKIGIQSLVTCTGGLVYKLR